MNKKLSLKKIYGSFFIGILIVNTLFIYYAIKYAENNFLIYTSIVLSISMFLLSFILAFRLKNINSLFINKVSETIDKMTNDEVDIKFNSDEETLFSRVEYRLNRLYEMMKSNKDSVNDDRVKLQELISDISHQVKTPVTNLKMATSFLKNDKLDEEMKLESINTIEKQVEKIDFLMEILIKTSRLEAGIIKLDIKPNYIYETIASAVGGIYLKASKKNLALEVNCLEDLIVSHDSKWTEEAIFNVLDNAVKYTAKGGKVSIKVEKWEKYTKIDISDTGIGIPENIQGKIFQRFYREQNLCEVEGIGVGLYLSREIISKEGGYIKVKSKKGCGSTFSIFLLN